MSKNKEIHRTTVDIEVSAFKEAQTTLGTRGYKETVNTALREVSRTARLHRAAELIRSGEIGLISPEELAEQRRPRS